MKYLFAFALLISLLACEKNDTLRTVETVEFAPTLTIGLTGGWGGGYAFKVVDGQLLRSVPDNFVGSPEDIANTVEFEPFDHSSQAALEQLLVEFPVSVFSDVPSKFDCEEEAYDGQCVFVIMKDADENVRYWTRSEYDDESAVTDYLDQVSLVYFSFYE